MIMNIKRRHELLAAAAKAARKAYAPYSGFRVGAALLPAGKRCILTGCNIENASFGLTICAERAALAAAVAAGFRRFEAIAIVAAGEKPVVPCGACLQTLAEFCAPDFLILVATTRQPDKPRVFTLHDLLPHIFRFRS